MGSRAAFTSYLVSEGRNGLHPDWCAPLIAPTATAADVERRLGPPDERAGFSLAYRLAAWPGYRYVFEFDAASGGLRRSGFERGGAVRPTPGGSPPVGATRDEIKAALGDPATVYGWWPVETWEYDSGSLLTFRHGILESSAGG